jgi:hypothetical protein
LEDDLRSEVRGADRLLIPLGHREDASPIGVWPEDNLLIAGPSSSGKSQIVTAFLEEVGRRGYQFSVIDPEGDYEHLEGAVSFGDANAPPELDAVMELLADPTSNAVVNLLGVPLEERPDVVETLLLRLQELRARVGRPHWLVIDEAHHGLPDEQGRAVRVLPKELHGMLFITVHPEHVARELLREVELLVVTADVRSTIEGFARVLGDSPSWITEASSPSEAVHAWVPGGDEAPVRFRPVEPEGERKRHLRKYAEGDVQEKAFIFRGREGKLKLRAQNLAIFAQIADGIDEETWRYHLERGDYSAWIESAIKDDELAEEVHAAESDGDPVQARTRILDAIRERYTLPT